MPQRTVPRNVFHADDEVGLSIQERPGRCGSTSPPGGIENDGPLWTVMV